MQHIRISTILIPVIIFSGACTTLSPSQDPTPTNSGTDEFEVRNLVETFGKRLQSVSILAPDAAQEIKDQYSEFVSPELLNIWMSDVSKAPGKITSSPWPDRIEIIGINKEDADKYVVTGFVMQVTSVEYTTGGAEFQTPMRIVVQKEQGRWIISEYAEER